MWLWWDWLDFLLGFSIGLLVMWAFVIILILRYLKKMLRHLNPVSMIHDIIGGNNDEEEETKHRK